MAVGTSGDVRYGRHTADELTDYYLEAARGRISGVRVVHKFGLAADIDAADGEVDIWDGMHEGIANITPYNWINGAPIDIQVSSSSALDVGVMISGEGLDENWVLQEGTATLNGQTPVPVGFQRRRIHRAYVSGSQAAVGDIYISDAGTPLVGGIPTDRSKIRAILHPDSQQTQMAIYTVPAGYDLFITHGWANVARIGPAAGLAGVRIYQRKFGGVFRVLHSLSLAITGSTGDPRPYTIPLRLTEKTDLIYRASVSANGMSVSAGFHGLLIRH